MALTLFFAFLILTVISFILNVDQAILSHQDGKYSLLRIISKIGIAFREVKKEVKHSMRKFLNKFPKMIQKNFFTLLVLSYFFYAISPELASPYNKGLLFSILWMVTLEYILLIYAKFMITRKDDSEITIGFIGSIIAFGLIGSIIVVSLVDFAMKNNPIPFLVILITLSLLFVPLIYSIKIVINSTAKRSLILFVGFIAIIYAELSLILLLGSYDLSQMGKFAVKSFNLKSTANQLYVLEEYGTSSFINFPTGDVTPGKFFAFLLGWFFNLVIVASFVSFLSSYFAPRTMKLRRVTLKGKYRKKTTA